MTLGKVVGTVVSTQKDPKLAGGKLLVIQQLDMQGHPTKTFNVAYDSVGAGNHEVVLMSTGSSARMAENCKEKPIDAVVLGIVDTLEIEGKVIYRKFE